MEHTIVVKSKERNKFFLDSERDNKILVFKLQSPSPILEESLNDVENINFLESCGDLLAVGDLWS